MIGALICRSKIRHPLSILNHLPENLHGKVFDLYRSLGDFLSRIADDGNAAVQIEVFNARRRDASCRQVLDNRCVRENGISVAAATSARMCVRESISMSTFSSKVSPPVCRPTRRRNHWRPRAESAAGLRGVSA